jgi:hypothetical protein
MPVHSSVYIEAVLNANPGPTDYRGAIFACWPSRGS